jgi:hypothetical protein
MQARYAQRAAPALKRLSEEAAKALKLARQVEREQLGLYLARAWMDGAMAGQDETLDQTAEQGYIVRERKVRAPKDG